MNTRGLLDQLLKSGQDMLQNKAGGQRKSNDKGALGGLLSGGGLGSMLGGAGGGALAAGAMGLLLGNKKAWRRPPKSLADYGHTEPGRGAEWWGKSVLLTFVWAGIPAFQK
jgi:uncharacterized membrane protein YebE (DUF533 family)